MEAKLHKIKINFNRIKDTRVQVMNVFSILEVKMNKLKNIQFVHNNTVGPRSISKQELIKEFAKVL